MSEEILKKAIDFAQVVGEEIRKKASSKDIDIRFKKKNEVVTDIDIWAEEYIKKEILLNFSNHLCIGEEYVSLQNEDFKLEEVCKNSRSEYLWLIDPIDGTNNFVQGIPHACVSIGILKNGKREIAVIYDPFRDEMFSAIKGKGAFINDLRIENKTNNQDLASSVVALGIGNHTRKNNENFDTLFKKIINSVRSVRVNGAAAIDQCWVALGRLDAYIDVGLKPWDIAAGSLIVEESGCVVANQNSNLDFNIFDNFFLFSNRTISKDLNNILENY